MKLENRSQLMEYLGAEQRNTVWSWCAINEAEKKVYLSVWTDFKIKVNGRMAYILQEPDWGVNEAGHFSAARNDHDEKFKKIFLDEYEPYGYFVEVKDKNAVPREILYTKTSFIFSLELELLESGVIIGYPKQRIEIK
ncbi:MULTISPECIES: hypothetical protein [Vibrio]|uniref:Uncharacterized protein n=2 Tax=Vibrio TaxID=662 RepID=U2ZIB3_VIBPR|nr:MULTISPECIES: hypothetical protein [Vibrio]MDK9795218.1 hypothetical protein [Vibrio sp. D431a]ELA8471129.1 hypothetical protein [Vibrio alginolyticus]MBS9976780.1 hypothetical protein [Vibrio alginolyticus]MBT0022946.1 hypothetical protein [Vibrio alginolyticus]MBY7710503.1 hypothetical protein [Vibrio alginolyticus]